MRGLLLTSLVPLLTLVPACGKSDCEYIYEKATECEGGKMGKRKKKSKDKDKDKDSDDDDDDMPSKDQFVAGCKLMLSDSKMKKELEDELECVRKDSCEEYTKCKEAARGKKRASSITKELEDGKVKDAFSSCAYSPEYFSDDAFKNACKEVFAAAEKVKDPEELQRIQYGCRGATFDKMVKAYPEFATTCKALAGVSYTKLSDKVSAARDSGKRDFSACHSLEEAAKTMDGGKDGEQTKKAKAACAEMNAAETVTRTLAAAKEAVKAGKGSFPYQCKSTLEDLAKIDSPWAKKVKDDVIKACYLDLGAVVLEAEGKKDMKYYCPFGLKELVGAVEKYDLASKNAELAEALKKLPATCSKP